MTRFPADTAFRFVSAAQDGDREEPARLEATAGTLILYIAQAMRQMIEGDLEGTIQAVRLASVIERGTVMPAELHPYERITLEDINRMVGRMAFGVRIEF